MAASYWPATPGICTNERRRLVGRRSGTSPSLDSEDTIGRMARANELVTSKLREMNTRELGLSGEFGVRVKLCRELRLAGNSWSVATFCEFWLDDD